MRHFFKELQNPGVSIRIQVIVLTTSEFFDSKFNKHLLKQNL